MQSHFTFRVTKYEERKIEMVKQQDMESGKRRKRTVTILLAFCVVLCACGVIWLQPKPITKHLHKNLTQEGVDCTIHYVTQNESNPNPNEQLRQDLSEVWRNVRVVGPLPAKQAGIDAEEVYLYLSAQTPEKEILRQTVQLFREGENYFINIGSFGYRVVSGQDALGAFMDPA